MFLHDSGEEYKNVSRQDASKMNAKAFAAQGVAQPAVSPTTSSAQAQQRPQAQSPSNQDPPTASSSQPIARRISQDQTMSRSNSADSSALPSSASWATKNVHNESRRSSKAASASASSPLVPNGNLASQAEDVHTDAADPTSLETAPHCDLSLSSRLSNKLFSGPPHPLDRAMKIVLDSSFHFSFDRSIYSEEVLRDIDFYPPLFDPRGGLIRYRMEKEREEERLKQEEQEMSAIGVLNTADEDEKPASGSLQLGGEPETQERSVGIPTTDRGAIQPLYPLHSPGSFPFSGSLFGNQANLNFNNHRHLQHHQSLQRSSGNQHSPVDHNYQQTYNTTNNASQHHHQPSNPFQNQTPGFGLASHSKQASRYTFANDSASPSTNVNPSSNAQLMAQQSAMMPTVQNKIFQSQTSQHPNLQNSHFYSNVQGPPPGLKSTGTPPISGGGMFGQGHGFGTPVGSNAGLNRANSGIKNGNEELMRDLLRGRNTTISGQGFEAGKREFDFSPFIRQSKTSSATPASSLLNSLYGSQLETYPMSQEHGLQKQKKKGKKHRHANTSSSGGGGIVDLADPSILQARMHHSGVGQGQFTAQGQGVYNLNNSIYGGGYGSRY